METKYFIESNGGQYGPADVDQLIQWISEGRIAPDTILVNAATTERTAAAMHPELSSWFAGARNPPPMPPMPPMPPPSNYPPAPQYGQPGGYAQQQAYRPPAQTQTYYGNAPLPSLGAGQYVGQNDSGTGSLARLPAQLQGLNWGGFFLTLLWAINNNTWIALLCLVPYIGWIMPFVVLFKGNEWAWQNRRFQSAEQFQAVQRSWAAWGIGVTVIGTILSFILFLILALIGGTNP